MSESVKSLFFSKWFEVYIARLYYISDIKAHDITISTQIFEEALSQR